jgi:hypothetical protein
MSIVALGAFCDLVPPEDFTASPGGLSFSVSEFAILGDGRRLTLHTDRGWTQWPLRALPHGEPLPDDWDARLDPRSFMTRESVVQDTLNVVLPDDDDDPDDHPYEWLAGLLAAQGVSASPEVLRTLPYTVELSSRLEDRLAALQADRS